MRRRTTTKLSDLPQSIIERKKAVIEEATREYGQYNDDFFMSTVIAAERGILPEQPGELEESVELSGLLLSVEE